MFNRNLTFFLCILELFILSHPGLAQVARPVVGEDSVYVAQEGDDLLSIAMAHRLAIEHLAFANGFPETSLDVVPGTHLVIPGRRILPKGPPKNGLVLNIPERGLYLFKDGQFADFIPVSVGIYPKQETPIGQFAIAEKVIDPTWYPTAAANEHKPVPPGPDNPLGDRWIGLTGSHVGIHGTNNPLNVGAPVTLGCIRCYPEEIRKLYPKVYVGMPVRIDYETAKVGRTKTGGLVLATFPDIYKRSNSYEQSQKLIQKIGRSQLLESKNFVQKLKLNLGVALSLEGR